MTNGQPELPQHKVAFVIDGEVVDVSDTTVDGNQIFPGFKYDSETKKFSLPNVEG